MEWEISRLHMPKLKPTKSKDLLKILKKHGFIETRQVGSHLILVNYQTNFRTTVPMHGRELPKGTLLAILRDVGLDKDDL